MLARQTAFLALLLLTAGCRGGTKTEPQIGWIRNMHELERYDAQEPSPYFEDGRAMRPPVEGAVAREMIEDPAVDTGLQDDGSYVSVIPHPIINRFGGMEHLVRHGQERYGIYCVPCHGGLGDGQGMVPNVSGVPAIRPPSFHDERLRQIPDGQLYATIRNGIRNMPAYQAQIPPEDRWAIVSYVRALQLSQVERRTAMRMEPNQ